MSTSAPSRVESVAELAPAATRGTTTIAKQVVEKVAAVAARRDSVSASSPGVVDSVLGRTLPRVEAVVSGQRARLTVEIATTWPTPLGQAAATVRDHVREHVQELTGLQVDAIDVEVAKVVRAEESTRRRVQ